MNETLLNQLKFQQVEHYSLPLVKQFYKKNGMRAQAPKGDIIYTAKHKQIIVGALRLQPIGTDYLLRSMCISADQRSLGIGGALLDQIQNHLSSIDCYCFPFSYLQVFYTKANFQLLTPEDAPASISQRFNRYIENGKDICLMKHHARI